MRAGWVGSACVKLVAVALCGLLVAGCSTAITDAARAPEVLNEAPKDHALVIVGARLTTKSNLIKTGTWKVLWARFDEQTGTLLHEERKFIYSRSGCEVFETSSCDMLNDVRYQFFPLQAGTYCLELMGRVSNSLRATYTTYFAGKKSALGTGSIYVPEVAKSGQEPVPEPGRLVCWRVPAAETVYLGDFWFAPASPARLARFYRSDAAALSALRKVRPEATAARFLPPARGSTENEIVGTE